MRNLEAPLYRKIIKLDRSRAIESYQDLKKHVLAIEITIEGLSKGFLNNEVRWIEVAIEKLSRRQKVSRWIELAIESALKRSLRVLIDSLSLENYQEAIEIA